MKNKKMIALIISALAIVALLIPASIYASDDKWGYAFRIKGYQENTRTGPRYRQTSNTENPWKVALEKSGEGTGTITTFWLEVKSGKNVSTSVNAKQGHAPYYTSAYDDANRVNVYLTAQNNNYNAGFYDVSGNWDEETK